MGNFLSKPKYKNERIVRKYTRNVNHYNSCRSNTKYSKSKKKIKFLKPEFEVWVSLSNKLSKEH